MLLIYSGLHGGPLSGPLAHLVLFSLRGTTLGGISMAGHKRFARLAVAALFASVFVAAPQMTHAQDSGSRKIKSQVQPVYPDVARRMNIHGKVKLEVTIAPDGSVKNIRCLGGHPLLVQPSQEAVAKWKYEPAPKETTMLVEVNFD